MAQKTIGHEPAFPEINHANPQFSNPTYGLTKREYFAVMAMQGISTRMRIDTMKDKNFVVENAVKYADLLIGELNK